MQALVQAQAHLQLLPAQRQALPAVTEAQAAQAEKAVTVAQAATAATLTAEPVDFQLAATAVLLQVQATVDQADPVDQSAVLKTAVAAAAATT